MTSATPRSTVSVREAAGWAAFRAARWMLAASACLLGRQAPLGHVVGDLASRLDRVPCDAARTV